VQINKAFEPGTDMPRSSSVISDDVPIIRIELPRDGFPLTSKDLWDYRELLYFLIWRDIKVRYSKPCWVLAGRSYSLFLPWLSSASFSGGWQRFPSDGIPYPLFSFAALVPWGFFANGLNHASNSLVSGSNLLKKIYFPRLAMLLQRY